MLEKAVIVKFEENRYSFKSKKFCAWCNRKFYKSIEEIKNHAIKFDFSDNVVIEFGDGYLKIIENKLNELNKK